MLFLGAYYRVCKKAVYFARPLYYYNRNADSIMQQSYEKCRFDNKKSSCLDAVSKLCELYQDDTKWVINCIAYRTVRTSLWLLYQMIYCGYYEKKVLFRIKRLIRQNYSKYWNNSYATFLEKVTAAGMCIFPRVVYLVGVTFTPIMKKRLEKYLS